MTVELINASKMEPDDLRMFPTGPDGVAQGCPLSAFAGNVALQSFDKAMNEPGRGIICIRYIDDFILIGRSFANVSKAMTSAERQLKSMGMSIYDPDKRPDKAFIGPIGDVHEFLGYKIVPSLYPPSGKACDQLLSRIRMEFSKGRETIKRTTGGGPLIQRESCFVQTLGNVDQILRGWIGSFRSSTCAMTMAHLDAQIDRMIADFKNFHLRVTRGLNPLEVRRAFGVRLLQDRDHRPVWQIDTL